MVSVRTIDTFKKLNKLIDSEDRHTGAGVHVPAGLLQTPHVLTFQCSHVLEGTGKRRKK